MDASLEKELTGDLRSLCVFLQTQISQIKDLCDMQKFAKNCGTELVFTLGICCKKVCKNKTVGQKWFYKSCGTQMICTKLCQNSMETEQNCWT